jgi:hypothetical protein
MNLPDVDSTTGVKTTCDSLSIELDDVVDRYSGLDSIAVEIFNGSASIVRKCDKDARKQSLLLF